MSVYYKNTLKNIFKNPHKYLNTNREWELVFGNYKYVF